jgi:hypothetical protein
LAVIEIARIQVRRGQENLTGIPQLAPGEFGWAQDTENLYIGKRIAEGANTDDNSRILTQKDYDNLFAIVSGAGMASVASTSSYRYRDNLDFQLFASTTTTIAKKLDAFVSLIDFGVTASSTATDIYVPLTRAIENLYANIYLYGDTRRNLIIPAGNYYLSDTVDLPPYTSLIGEGIGITTIISQTNDRPLFRTVDGNGVAFESTMAEQQSSASSKNVSIKNMTLAYTASTSTLPPLILLDNTRDSTVDSVEFTVVRTINTSTGTIILNTSTSYGVGLSLRGDRRSGIEQNKNVTISNSKFKNIGLGVLGTGSCVYSKIEDCVFSELIQGINFSAFDGDVYRLAPSKATITKNLFENIQNQAIFVGTSTDQINFKPNLLNHSSSYNDFYRVGNGPDLGDGITNNTGTAIISNFGEGFVSISDRFSRKDYANPNLRPEVFNFFYKPLIEGSVSLESGTTLEIRNLTFGKQTIDRLYVGPEPVSYKIPYVLTEGSNNYCRSGLLTITASGNPNYFNPAEGSVSDYFDYNFNTTWAVASTSTSFDLSGALIQPIFNVEPGINPSHLLLTYTWGLSAPPGISTFIGTITNVSNADPAVVTTQDAHSLSSGTQVVLNGILGMSNFFSSTGATEYYAWVLSANTFALYWDSTLLSPLNTSGLTLYDPASTATVVTINQGSQLKIEYQTNITS